MIQFFRGLQEITRERVKKVRLIHNVYLRDGDAMTMSRCV